VVAELELNSVIPPPDTIEEVKKALLTGKSNKKSLIHITQPNVWRYQEASEGTFLRRKGLRV
jgi:hypothetical protein